MSDDFIGYKVKAFNQHLTQDIKYVRPDNEAVAAWTRHFEEQGFTVVIKPIYVLPNGKTEFDEL